MPRNNHKNSAKSNSNSFQLLSEAEDDTNEDEIPSSVPAGTSTRGRPLKRTQPYDPESPPRKKSVPTKPRVTGLGNSNTTTDQLLRIEALFKRVESLEEFIRNELFPRVAGPAPVPAARPASPPSPPPSPVRGPLPGIGLDLSHVQDREIKEGNAGVVRRRANEALREKGITCLEINSKGKGRYRLLFKEADIDGLRRDDSWLGPTSTRERSMESNGTLFGLIGHVGKWQQTS